MAPTHIHGVCPHDCYDTCGLDIEVDNGLIQRIRGQRDHAVTRGFLCVKVNHYLERLNHADRILYPLKRAGKKGQGVFRRVSWEEALDGIAEAIQDRIDRFGGESVLPYSFAGNMGLLSGASMDRRFFHAIGASELQRTICSAASDAAFLWVYGQRLGPDPETIPRARFILLWGSNPVATNVHAIPLLDEARRLGAQVWVVDPLRTETARRYDRHLAVRPNMDLALALAAGRELIDSGRYDRQFVETTVDGFDEYVRAVEPWTVDRASRLTGLDAGAIRDLAVQMAGEGPFLLRSGYGVQRQLFGAQTVWALSALSLLTGAPKQIGGGHLLGNDDAFPLNRRRLGGHHMARQAVRRINMLELGRALTQLNDPPVQVLVVYNANPAATAPDQSAVLKGLQRDDLITVVHEQMMTDTAKWADWVLPAAMGMEVLDLHVSYWHRYVQLNQPAVPPAGEAVSNTEFFRRLAQKMGLPEPELRASDEDLIRDALSSGDPWLDGITLESLRDNPVQKVRIDVSTRPFLDTPIKTPSGRLNIGPLPGLSFDLDNLAPGSYPFHLITPSARETIKSSFRNVGRLRMGREEPELLMASEDVDRGGYQEGQWVVVANALGETRMRLVRSDVPAPGTVVSYAVCWNHEDGGRNVNQLTSQRLSDAGGGATFYSTWVTVRMESESDVG